MQAKTLLVCKGKRVRLRGMTTALRLCSPSWLCGGCVSRVNEHPSRAPPFTLQPLVPCLPKASDQSGTRSDASDDRGRIIPASSFPRFGNEKPGKGAASRWPGRSASHSPQRNAPWRADWPGSGLGSTQFLRISCRVPGGGRKKWRIWTFDVEFFLTSSEFAPLAGTRKSLGEADSVRQWRVVLGCSQFLVPRHNAPDVKIVYSIRTGLWLLDRAMRTVRSWTAFGQHVYNASILSVT